MRLQRFLRVVGIFTLLAFAAAFMPAQWIVQTSEFFGFDPFPHSPLTFYLARHLSLLYGFVGVLFLLIAADLERFVGLIRPIAIMAILLGLAQAAIDWQSGLPWWWTAGESISTIMGGTILWWLSPDKQSPSVPNF